MICYPLSIIGIDPEGDRWKLYIKGLGVTLEIAFFAAIIGLLIGTVVALMRLSTKRNGKKTIWAWAAVLSFGINSGAYVSEIVRAGILAVDKGQTEAGRSLGLSKAQTMLYIVIPQAIKNVLPPIGNEFIVLLKETAIVGYAVR